MDFDSNYSPVRGRRLRDYARDFFECLLEMTLPDLLMDLRARRKNRKRLLIQMGVSEQEFKETKRTMIEQTPGWRHLQGAR